MNRAGRALLAAGMLLLGTVSYVRAQEASVKAVLFYNPGCGACKTLINETLPPLLLQYDRNLLIYTIDITQPEGSTLYHAALDALTVPDGHQGVPLLVVDDTYLAGLTSIQDQFPTLIEQKLAQGGTGWPSIPGLESSLQKAGFAQTTNNPWNRFLADQPANTLAILVLAFLFLSLGFSILITFRPPPKFMENLPEWLFPVLLVAGLIVASYLTYTETTQSEVFCGGISHCTEVQDSQYSKLLGVINIGEFGVLGYCLIGLSWIVHRFLHGLTRTTTAIAMFGFAVFGVSYSLYLTFLEPFVIGATCLWCLSSAIIMGLILPLTTGPVRIAVQSYTTSPGAGAVSDE
jgi:uncharacterized membrane protein